MDNTIRRRTESKTAADDLTQLKRTLDPIRKQKYEGNPGAVLALRTTHAVLCRQKLAARLSAIHVEMG